MSTPPDLWFDTEHDGRILDWSPDALTLIGYSDGGAKGRSLPLMFIGSRPLEAHLTRVMFGHPLERDGIIRPRDRRGVPVTYRIALADGSTDKRPVLRWTFQRR